MDLVFQLRSACSADFGFAWSLYRGRMKPLTVELLGRWNEPGQKRVVELALTQEGTSIIIIDGSDVQLAWQFGPRQGTGEEKAPPKRGQVVHMSAYET